MVIHKLFILTIKNDQTHSKQNHKKKLLWSSLAYSKIELNLSI